MSTEGAALPTEVITIAVAWKKKQFDCKLSKSWVKVMVVSYVQSACSLQDAG